MKGFRPRLVVPVGRAKLDRIPRPGRNLFPLGSDFSSDPELGKKDN